MGHCISLPLSLPANSQQPTTTTSRGTQTDQGNSGGIAATSQALTTAIPPAAIPTPAQPTEAMVTEFNTTLVKYINSSGNNPTEEEQQFNQLALLLQQGISRQKALSKIRRQTSNMTTLANAIELILTKTDSNSALTLDTKSHIVKIVIDSIYCTYLSPDNSQKTLWLAIAPLCKNFLDAQTIKNIIDKYALIDTRKSLEEIYKAFSINSSSH